MLPRRLLSGPVCSRADGQCTWRVAQPSVCGAEILTSISEAAPCPVGMFPSAPSTSVGKLYEDNGLMWGKYQACGREIKRDFNNAWDRQVKVLCLYAFVRILVTPLLRQQCMYLCSLHTYQWQEGHKKWYSLQIISTRSNNGVAVATWTSYRPRYEPRGP